jgi:RsiW-degrading membrane proteinase PrsW (M82 family)
MNPPSTFRKQLWEGKDNGLHELPIAAFLPIFHDAVRRAEIGIKSVYHSFQMSPESVENDKNAPIFGSWVERHICKGEYRESTHCGFDVDFYFESPAGAVGFSKGERVARVVFSVSPAIKPLSYGCFLVSIVWLLFGCLLFWTVSSHFMDSIWIEQLSPKMDERYVLVLFLCSLVAAGLTFLMFGLFLAIQERCFPSERQLRSKTLAASVWQIVEEAFINLEKALPKTTVIKASDKIQIIRDGVAFGPYTISDALVFLERGLLFEHDLALVSGMTVSQAKPLLKLLVENNAKPKVVPVWRQLAWLVRDNHALLIPVRYLFSLQVFKDKRTLSLMAVGCTPLVLIIVNSTLVSYAGLAAYFSVLWGMFFFSVFKTSQSVARDAIRVFIQTPLLASVLISIARYVPPLATLYDWTTSGNVLMRWAGMFLAVAIIEEICKVLPVYFLARHPGRVLQPRTVVLYGIISGLGFGIWEGVAYQWGINREHDVDMAYFLNVLRLTSLPFIHAIWAGISSYFVGFSMLLPGARWSLRIVAVLIPAVLHSVHNSFPGALSAVVDLFSVALLMLYLGNGQALFAKMKKGAGVKP